MAYEKQTFVNNSTALQAEHLQHIEDGIVDTEAAANQAAQAASDAQAAVGNHATRTDNPHNVTAAQVGARPDTWTPTAAQVGARESTWLPTIGEIGAAPAGYGWGEEEAPCVGDDGDIPEACEITKTGLYQVNDVTPDAPSGGEIAPLLHLTADIGTRNDPPNPTMTQFVVDWQDSIIYRHKGVYSDGYSPWRFLTHPLQIGVEYLTGERFLGAPVYIKAVNCGTIPVGSGCCEIVNWSNEAVHIIDWYGIAGPYPLPIPPDPAGQSIDVVISETDIYLNCDGIQWERKAVVVVKYTKIGVI